MPPKLALVLGAICAWLAFRGDRLRPDRDVSGLFWPTLWYLVVASRPVGVWLVLWGVPMPAGGGDPTEGSSIDRYFFGALTVIGFWILSRRKFNWGSALRANSWLTSLLVVMAVSVFWSSYPFVSFKRFIKILGAVVMALVVLTNDRPFEAVLTVLRRCLYVHLPMSIICVKYFREIGVSFDWSGAAESWQGIATSKNTLGQIAMLGVMYFLWDIRRSWGTHRWKSFSVLYLLMALYLLKGSEDTISMTSVAVCVFAIAVFSRIQALRLRIASLRSFVHYVFGGTLALIVLILIHSIVHFSEGSLLGKVITAFGRDITLTDRTFIWTDVYAAVDNPVIGVGFGGFWIGRLANIPWNENMTWVLGQGHSGYVDTYLQLGFLGLFVFTCVLMSTLPRLLRSFDQNFDFGCFRITLFLTILFINITETTFLRGDHHLWFVFMLVLWVLPEPAVPVSTAAEPQETTIAESCG